MKKYLEKLIDELQHLQNGIDCELYTDRFIHNKLINVCQNIPACQYACFKPADSLAGLINDLCSSVITYKKANSPSKVFFTDRQYHKYDRRFNNSDSNQIQPRISDNKKKKKCFVYLKIGCWSSKNTKEECKKSKNRFKEQFDQRFDRKIAQYIANFEEMEFSSDNDLDELNEVYELDKLDELDELNELKELDEMRQLR